MRAVIEISVMFLFLFAGFLIGHHLSGGEVTSRQAVSAAFFALVVSAAGYFIFRRLGV